MNSFFQTRMLTGNRTLAGMLTCFCLLQSPEVGSLQEHILPCTYFHGRYSLSANCWLPTSSEQLSLHCSPLSCTTYITITPVSWKAELYPRSFPTIQLQDKSLKLFIFSTGLSTMSLSREKDPGIQRRQSSQFNLSEGWRNFGALKSRVTSSNQVKTSKCTSAKRLSWEVMLVTGIQTPFLEGKT